VSWPFLSIEVDIGSSRIRPDRALCGQENPVNVWSIAPRIQRWPGRQNGQTESECVAVIVEPRVDPLKAEAGGPGGGDGGGWS
jgi:hypothetical protein